MASSAFVIGYGPTGRAAAERAVALQQPDDTMRCLPDADQLESALCEVGMQLAGNVVLRVIHVAELEDEQIRTGLRKATGAVREVIDRYPAALVQQFVVALVDRDWEDVEAQALDGLDEGVKAVFVVSRSNEAALQLDEAHERAMAADLVYAVVHAPELTGVVDSSMFWLAGTSAVYYRKHLILAALTAHHVSRFFRDQLLAPLAPDHTECKLGANWVSEQNLGLAPHLQVLERSPMGGSVTTEIEIDRTLFRQTPPELLVDALRSFAVQNATKLAAQARIQIDRNSDADKVKRITELERVTADLLRDKLQISAARRYVECVADELDAVLQRVQVVLTKWEVDDVEDRDEQLALEQELTRTIRRLPYPIAATARAVGFGAAGVAAYHLFAALLGLDPNFAVAGLLIGLVFGVPLAGQYARQLRRITALRESYLEITERRARHQVIGEILRAAFKQIQQLQAAATRGGNSLKGRLDQLQQTSETLCDRYEAMAASRESDAITATKLSKLVPEMADLSTEALATELPLPASFALPELIARVLVSKDEIELIDIDKLDAALVAAFTQQMQAQVWQSLAELMNNHPLTKKTIEDLFDIRTGTIVRAEQLHQSGWHYMKRAVFNKDANPGLAHIFTTRGIGGPLHADDPNSAIQIALLPAAQVMTARGGDRHE